MNVFIPDGRIDQFILEDMPYIDLTTEVLGIGEEPGEIEYFTRKDCVLAGAEEAARVLGKTGARVTWSRRSGERLAAGEPFLRAEGTAAALHMAWKASLNLCDHLSGVATKTRAIVDAAHSANPACEVLTTRKSMPGVKDLLTKAVTCGGAFPHRLGASETVLVFDHHITFMGGFEAFLEALPALRGRVASRKRASTASSSTRCRWTIWQRSCPSCARSTLISRSSRRAASTCKTLRPMLRRALTAWPPQRPLRRSPST